MDSFKLAPYLLMGPHVFDGSITLGAYVQSQGAFRAALAGLTYPIDQWVDINELLSVSRRLREFEAALPALSDLKPADETTRLIGKGDESPLTPPDGATALGFGRSSIKESV